jgi:hypothetical protein
MQRKNISKLNLLFSFLSLLVLSSCLRTYKLVPTESYQGEDKKKNEKVVNNNLRSVKIYDEWETDAMFDVLWLSDSSRRTYVDSYCAKTGKGGQDREQIMREELSKNSEKISFYILADIRDKFHPSLSDKTPAWSIHLDISGKKIFPSHIEEATIEPEYLAMLGCCYTKPKFKIPYLVEFDSQDTIEGKPYKMVLSSVAKRCELGWNGAHPPLVKVIGGKGPTKGRIKGHENWYWL